VKVQFQYLALVHTDFNSTEHAKTIDEQNHTRNLLSPEEKTDFFKLDNTTLYSRVEDSSIKPSISRLRPSNGTFKLSMGD
jgi:hypothetical protein